MISVMDCVDDSPDMLEILVDLLQSEFRIVGTLCSGASAVEKATTLNPDVILLDASENKTLHGP
jgi:chemotaxis response regulator CheB